MAVSERVRPRREDVRADILEAGVVVFTREGFAGASMQKIAAEAGFTKGALYSNFSSKQALFAAIMQARFSEVRVAVLEGISPTEGGWRGATAQASELLAQHIAGLAPLHSLMIEFALQASRDPEAREVYLELRRSQRAELAEALRSRSTDLQLAAGIDFDRVATTILALISGLAIERILDPQVPTAAIVHDALLGALAGRE